MQSGNPEKIGEMNRQLILDCVRKHGPLSRADLQRILNISFPAISANVKRLLEGGYLLEAGSGGNKLGRKSTLLQFNAARAHVIGVDLGRSQIRAMLADLDGSELNYHKEPLACSASEDQKLEDRLSEMFSLMMESSGVRPESVECIAIGFPGVPDKTRNRLLIAPFMTPPDLSAIEENLRVLCPNASILMENAVNYGAIGEKWHGAARDYRDIAYINYGVGIGAALVLNGALYHGANGAAGEIGFMLPDTRHARDSFDEQGVLETLISGRYISRMLTDRGLDADIREILNRSAPGEANYDDIVQRIVDYIGCVLVNITAVFNEEIIVLGGGLSDSLSETFIPVWKDMLARHVPFVPEIVVSQLHSRANVLGAIAAAIRNVNDAIAGS